MKRKHISQSAVTLLLVGAVFLAAVPALAPVLAQGPQPPAPLPRLGGAADRLLARAYQREQAWLATQENHLARAAQAADRAEELLARAEEEGKDVAALEAALAAFQTDLSDAQQAHDEAAAILDEHEGFGEDGLVCDRVAARRTVVRAHRSLAEARRILLKAVRDLSRAVRE